MSLLPLNATPIERAVESAARLDLATPIAELWDPLTCPESALPWLAWALHMSDAEGWKLAATTDQRRALLAKAIALHRKKGTPWSIVEALKAIGFNDAEILERLPVNRFDGGLTFAGAANYDAYGWAEFRVIADVGDTQPISSNQTARIVETVNEWKPARCHLADIQYRASIIETVTSGETASISMSVASEELMPWGRAYDGGFTYSQGVLHNYDGQQSFDGSIAHVAFRGTGIVHDAVREADSLAGAVVIADRQARYSLFDGYGDYSGAFDFGHSAPVAEDPPMEIAVTRHLHYDGRMNYAANRFSGARRYSGEISYYGNVAHVGDVTTYLEA